MLLQERGLEADLQRFLHVASQAGPPTDLPGFHPIDLPQQLLIPCLDREPIIHRGPC